MTRRILLAALIAVVSLGYYILAAKRAPMPLLVNDEVIARLTALRAEAKFLDLPGAPAVEERRRLEPLINSLLDRIIAGVRAHPTDAWVIEQMDSTVEEFHLEDSEARERCLAYIESIFQALGIPDDRGAFRKYMIIW